MQKIVVAIEDDPQIAELLELLLASDELKTVNFVNGEEGLAAVFANPPDLILLDVMIPGMNGWDVYDRIRQHEPTKQLPIIMVSVTQPTNERRAAFSASPIDFYVSKPFDILDLRAKINSLLNISHWQVAGTMPKPLNVKRTTIRNISNTLIETAEAPKPVLAKEELIDSAADEAKSDS